MPISEDELDHKGPPQGHHGYHPHLQNYPHPPSSGMSKAEQRRSNKPIMEKRRRARINHCLNELKSLILDAMKKDPARHSKLEKADILEMTVKHLQNMQRQQLAVAVATDPTVLHKFRTGFNECAGEVSRYIGRIEGVDPAVRSRLLSHLSSCVSGLHQLTPFSFGAMAAAANPPPPPPGAQVPFAAPPTPPAGNPHLSMMAGEEGSGGVLPCGTSAGAPQAQQPHPPPPPPFASGDVNNNQSQQQSAAARLMAGLQLIPSRLPTGELALLLPGSGRLSDSTEGGTSFSSSVSPGISTSLSTSSSSALNTSGPSPSASASPRGPTHHSAFTAVTRSSLSPPSPPPVQTAVGPASPASSTSSSCASTSCDSSSFTAAAQQHSQPTLPPPPPTSMDDGKLPMFNFRCPPLHHMSFGADIKAFPFPPLSLPTPSIDSSSQPSFMESSGLLRTLPPLKIDAGSDPQEPVQSPRVLNLEKVVTSTGLSGATAHSQQAEVQPVVSLASTVSPMPRGLFPDSSSSATASITTHSEDKVPCPSMPSLTPTLPPFFPTSLPSTRDPLDFSVKKERYSEEEFPSERVPRVSLGFGMKRPSDDSECASDSDNVMKPAKIARLEVKVEPSPIAGSDGVPEAVVSDGKIAVEVVAQASSSSITSSANSSTEESSSLDMWRPW
ncbi:flocculation protein FLO11-like [Ischnura elegans]|uniref:flocculation protein FLO11-like n=1 Tax=Ischnura elegans TaxID=197161 RepID=UPI001ED87D7B|nr:flocculation protein FLO11-like [Ischnura elegans]